MSDLRWGILGCGWIAGQAIAPALSQLPGVRVHSALSRERTRAEAFCEPYGARSYDDLDAFLADPELDAVYVATPNFRHGADVQACAAAGKHVLCDKPLAADAAEAAAMVEACHQAGVKLGVGFQLRFHPAHAEMARRIAAGELGMVSHAQAQMCFRYPWEPSPWRRKIETAGGGWATSDLGSHLADLLLHLLGPARRVQAILGHRIYGYTGEDLASALIEFDSGVVATLLCSTGTDSLGSQLAVYGECAFLHAEGTIGLGSGGSLRQGGGGEATPLLLVDAYPTLYHAELAAFSRAVVEDLPPPVPGEDGLRVAALLDAIRNAGRSGRAVDVTPAAVA